MNSQNKNVENASEETQPGLSSEDLYESSDKVENKWYTGYDAMKAQEIQYKDYFNFDIDTNHF